MVWMCPCLKPGCSMWFTVVPPRPTLTPRSCSSFTTACPSPQHNWAAQDWAHHQHTVLHHCTSSHMHLCPSFSSWSGNKNLGENPGPWGFTGLRMNRAATQTQVRRDMTQELPDLRQQPLDLQSYAPNQQI